MSTNREKMTARIRKLLAMTKEAGCTEAEAMEAIAKASALMAEHQISMTETELVGEGFERIFREFQDKRKGFAANYIAVAIGQYTDCKPAKHGSDIAFFGMKSDADFAGWLLDSLSEFILSQADRHIRAELAKIVRETGMSARAANSSIAKRKGKMWVSFVFGCCARIGDRMRATKPVQQVRASSTSTALVVIDKARIVEEEFEKRHGKLKKARPSTRRIDGASYSAGQTAGDRATINRPIGHSSSSGLLR